MTVSRDISGASLPFAAGAALGALLPLWTAPGNLYYFCGAALAIVTVSVAALWKYRSYPYLLLMFLSAGLFCALSWHIGTAGGHPGGLPFSLRAGGALRDAADSIPFSDRQAGALVKALITGDKSSLSRDTVKLFRQSGAAHILALSGMHLGIIYLILKWLLVPLGNSPVARKLKYMLTVSFSGIYCLATGAGPSIVRAFLFIFLWESASLLGRKVTPVKIWCGGLTLQLALNPSVVSSTGFQLSYLAMAGIFLLYPVLRDWYPSEGGAADRLNLPKRIWEAASLAISCQVFTAPLSWMTFGTFPRYYLLTNLLAMPVASLLTGLSAATVALGAAGLCPQILITADEAVCRTLLYILSVISSI